MRVKVDGKKEKQGNTNKNIRKTGQKNFDYPDPVALAYLIDF